MDSWASRRTPHHSIGFTQGYRQPRAGKLINLLVHRLPSRSCRQSPASGRV
jgi:hypothetical protein